MSKRRNRSVYVATVYHDTEYDAMAEAKDLGYFPSLDLAVKAINAERGDYWQTGGVTYGFLWEAVFGKSPEYFESDERELGWFVGTDGKAEQ